VQVEQVRLVVVIMEIQDLFQLFQQFHLLVVAVDQGIVKQLKLVEVVAEVILFRHL
jgi:hypothetical protein|tara:strand:- start:453 stop:620 length:168 start_codon:yes stop_codon:yes gene_type:complete